VIFCETGLRLFRKKSSATDMPTDRRGLSDLAEKPPATGQSHNQADGELPQRGQPVDIENRQHEGYDAHAHQRQKN
jgi:hypothetical protein